MTTKNTRISIVLLGEKDHGKSTLIGRLIFETKSLPEDRMRDVKKAMKGKGKKFEWAHLLDSFVYEREHEMTLDTTRAMVNFGGKLFEFIDVPGHKELIKNMLTGAGDAKFAILVIDINEGIKPQTLRHLDIAEFLGIKKLIIAVNKMDKINYSLPRYNQIVKTFRAVLSVRSFDKKITFIPVAAFSGNNLLRKTGLLKSFKGPTLVSAILSNFKNTKKISIKQQPARSRHIHPLCLFIEKPSGKLKIESGVNSFQLTRISDFKKIHELNHVSLELSKSARLEERFVIKQKGRIIGVCKAI